jgi:hypothetical protein
MKINAFAKQKGFPRISAKFLPGVASTITLNDTAFAPP